MGLIPMVVESDGRMERSFDIYSRLLRDRIVFLGQEVDDAIANVIMAQLLFLEAEDSKRDISLYVNSPGGSGYAGMAIYDTMQHVRPDVRTICCGIGMSAAATILTGGAPGKRFALPHAKMMIHQGTAGFRGAPTDIQIAAREIAETTQQMAEVIARHTSRAVEQANADRVELELGFENGGLLRCAVEATDAAQVVRAFRDDPGGLVAIDAEKGRLVIDLRRVAYVRELARRDSIGFGLRAT